MAVELQGNIEDQLSKLPENHPDRKFLRAQLDIFRAYTSVRRDVEQQAGIKSFSPEAAKALERMHLRVYVPRGLSLRALQESGRRFWYINPALRDLTSGLNSEVAIRPGKLFLPNSFGKLPRQQEEIVQDFSRKLADEVPSVQAVIADEPSVWGEIWHMHFEQMNEVLFGPKEEFRYTVTKTSAGFGFAVFGSAYADRGPGVNYWSPGGRNPFVGVALLVVPT